MILTPDDVHVEAFAKARVWQRGYDRRGVDDYMEHVEDTLRRLYQRIDQLTEVNNGSN